MPLKDDLAKFLSGEVIDDDQTLNNFSKDASVFEIKPQLVVAPKNVNDLKKLVKFVNDHPDQNLSLTPRAGGTCMSGGAINDSIILDMTKHFHQICEITPEYAITQPGVFYRDFDLKTQKIDRFFPPYTSSRDLNTIGGMIGNNSAGEKTLSYGATIDYVEELKMVMADGQEHTFKPLTPDQLKTKLKGKDFEAKIYKRISKLINQNRELIEHKKPHTTKNSTGYYLWDVEDNGLFDLTKLIVGSQGTLGIVTEAKIRLVKPKPYSTLLVIYLNSTNRLGDLVNQILAQHPESLESYDDQTLKIAAHYLPEIYKTTGGNIIKFYFNALSEIMMAARNHYPKLILMAEFTGETEDEAKQKLATTRDALAKYKLKMHNSTDHLETCKFWSIRRQSFGLLRHHAAAQMHTAPFIDDIVVDPYHLPEFLPKLHQIIQPYKRHLVYTLAGHMGNGNFHIIPLMNFDDPKTFEIIPELSAKVFDLVKQYQGTMAGEHNDGLIRGVFLKDFYGSHMYDLFKEVKHIFDPNNIFNPHKKTDADWEFYKKSLAKPHPSISHTS